VWHAQSSGCSINRLTSVGAVLGADPEAVGAPRSRAGDHSRRNATHVSSEASKGSRMIQQSDDEEPPDGRDAGTEPTKRVRRRRAATVADIRAAIRRIEERQSAGQRGDG
jgi:hypothetical protein